MDTTFLSATIAGVEQRLPVLQVAAGAVHYLDLQFGDYVPYDQANSHWRQRLKEGRGEPLVLAGEDGLAFRIDRGPVVIVREPLNLALDFQLDIRLQRRPSAYLVSNLCGCYAGDDGYGFRYREASGKEGQGRELVIAPLAFFAELAVVIPGRRKRLSPLAA